MDNKPVTCYRCGGELKLPEGNVGRSETCPKCGFDVRVCKNCMYYDLNSYNECREPSAERVVDKEKRNFCDYFSLKQVAKEGTANSRDDALKKLNDLFK